VGVLRGREGLVQMQMGAQSASKIGTRGPISDFLTNNWAKIAVAGRGLVDKCRRVVMITSRVTVIMDNWE